MDAEIKKQLDLRLAKGEISKEEYVSLWQTLQPENAQAPTGRLGPLAFLAQSKDKIFGSNQMIVPTDEHPLVVDENLTLYGQHLTDKGTEILYADVESVRYKASSHSINLVPISISTLFFISCKGGHSICVGTNTMIFKGKKAKLIQNAYAFLQQVTFRRRVGAYLHTLKAQGYLDIGEVRLFPNGDIQKGEIRLNLKQARRNKAFGVGTHSGWGRSRSSNPDEVIVGDTGTSIFSKRIIFELGTDKDVKKALLEWLSENDAS